MSLQHPLVILRLSHVTGISHPDGCALRFHHTANNKKLELVQSPSAPSITRNCAMRMRRVNDLQGRVSDTVIFKDEY